MPITLQNQAGNTLIVEPNSPQEYSARQAGYFLENETTPTNIGGKAASEVGMLTSDNAKNTLTNLENKLTKYEVGTKIQSPITGQYGTYDEQGRFLPEGSRGYNRMFRDTTKSDKKTTQLDTKVGGLESDISQLDNTLQSLISDFQSYNVDKDPAFAAVADNIASTYDRIQRDMERTNFSRQRALETLGYRTGSAQYAGAIMSGIVGEEISQGNQRIADINREEAIAIAEARQAFETREYTKFAQKMEMLDTLRDNKVEELTRYNNKLAEAAKQIETQNKFELDVLKYQLDLQKAKETTQTKEYNLAKEQGFEGSFMDYQLYREEISQTMPTTFREWQLAGGEEGTGKTYAEFLDSSDALQGAPNSYKEWVYAGQPGSYQEWVKKTDLRPLPSADVRMLSEARQLPLVLDSLESLLDETDPNNKIELFGPVKGLLGRQPYAKEAQKIDDDLRRASQVIGRFMEGGVLRKEDEEKYRRMLPQLTDLPSVAQDKLKGVKDLLEAKTAQLLTDYELSGYNVSQFLGTLPGTENLQNNNQNPTTLDNYYIQNPGERDNIEQMIYENPDLDNTEILQILLEPTFSMVGSDTNKAVKLGSRLAKVNNNPGNLRYVGQKGAVKGEGGFAKFKTPEAGYQALKDQIKLDSSRGLTLEKFINKYAPPSENDTKLYTKQIVNAVGKDSNTKLKNIDINKLAKAIAKKESSTIIL